MNHTQDEYGGRPLGAGPSSFASLIAEAIAERSAYAQTWTIEHDPGDARVWIRVFREDQPVPDQGWKLHVSALTSSAQDVLRRALDVLLQEESAFKVAEEHALDFLNSGDAGLSQVGKFITVYPQSEDRAVRLAIALDAATRGLRGPAVPFERSVAKGSLVHYRYGSFNERLVQDPSGVTVDAIDGPDGQLVADDSSQQPEWVVDPFAAAGLGCPPSSRVVAGRFPLTTSLQSSATGGVYLSVDPDSGQAVVLKRARRDTRVSPDGRDARDHLRQEAAVLEKLQPDDRFPKLAELIEHEDDLYLLMNYIKGSLLGDYVSAFRRAGGVLGNDVVIAWGCELASALERIHEEGLAYRDLNPANVLVTEDKHLRLVDLGSSVEFGGDVSAVPVGTRGYLSKQQAAGDPPTIADDIYGLGAMLYFLATGADPARAPDPFRLTSRPTRFLNPSLSPAIASLIERCLAQMPGDRPRSMTEVAAALESAGRGASPSPRGLEEEVPGEPEEEFRGRCRDNARRLGDTLCLVAFPPEGVPMETLGVPNAINGGIAGPVLALAELVATFDDPSHRLVLERAVKYLERAPLGERAGLYAGTSGVGAAVLRAGQVTRNDDLIHVAATISEKLANSSDRTTDLFAGMAGRALFHLLVWDETEDDRHLAVARTAGDRLIQAARRDGSKAWWDAGEQALAGWAFGTAGIADVLLDLFEASADERFAEAAVAAALWLDGLQTPALGDHGGSVWRERAGGPRSGISWREGAAGIGRFFLHAAELGAYEEADAIALKAARTVARQGRAVDPSQGNGLSGCIEFLLDAAGLPGDERCRSEAMMLGRVLETWAVEDDGLLVWPSGKPDDFTPDYVTGFSGVAICLLRLADPESRPYLFSRKGFRFMNRPATETSPA